MNFKPLTYLLKTAVQKAAAIRTIDNLPLDDECPLEVLIREYVKQRTMSQNSYYWMRITEIAEQAWINAV